MIFYDFSGGMESAAMLALERDRIVDLNCCVRWADTGKQFPEMADSIREIERNLGIRIYTVPRRITFDEFLFDKGGMVRKGTTDCSRRMKRANLMAHMKTFPKPCKWNNTLRGGKGGFEDAHEVNLGFNRDEDDRADAFTDRNERDWLHWRFPLIERNVSRAETVEICKDHGFTILVAMYELMGRFDCYFCGNQTPAQALKVAKYYPELAKEWMEAEARKGHSFMPVSLKVLVDREEESFPLFAPTQCACFGGDDDFVEDSEPAARP